MADGDPPVHVPDDPSEETTDGSDDTGADEAAADEAALAEHARALLDAVDRSLDDWVRSSVRGRCRAAGIEVGAVGRDAIEEAVAACRGEVLGDLADLLQTDVDEQCSTPLTLVRAAVRFPTAVLVALGVPESERDDYERRALPEDRYALSPATMADLGEEAGSAAIVWGAAKAHVHLRRRRRESRR